MKIAVRYSSKSGRTKKIADAIAQVANTTAKSANEALSNDVDVLFLGSGVYATIGSEIKSFISSNTHNIGLIVTFSTSAIIESAHEQIKKVALKYGYSVSEKEFHCPGVLALRYRGRPNYEDIEKAKYFTQEFISNFKG